MKIGIIADSIDIQYAGIHFYTKHLLDALARVDSENEFVVVKQTNVDENLPLPQTIIPPTFSFLRLDPLRTFFRIPRFFNRKKVDVVIEPAHFGPFNLNRKIKRVTVIHDLTPLILSQFHPWHSSFLQKIMLKRILNRADLILANSENTKNDIQQFYPNTEHKIKRIYLGRDEGFQPTENDSALRKYGIKKPYILFVGTIEPRKNLLELLEAYSFVRKKGLPHQLVLAGKDGWQNDAFKRALANHEFNSDIILTGYTQREELPQLYSHADVFVYPSLYEGFGFPVVEAMSCGTPAVVSNSSSLPEVGGEAVLSYKLGNAADLASKLHDLLTDPEKRKKMSKLSLIQVQQYSWDRYAKELLEILCDL